MIALWAAAVYLAKQQKNYWICALPAAFMTAVSATYFFSAPECLGLLWKVFDVPFDIYYPMAVVIGIIFAIGLMGLFLWKWQKKTAQYLSSNNG